MSWLVPASANAFSSGPHIDGTFWKLKSDVSSCLSRIEACDDAMKWTVKAADRAVAVQVGRVISYCQLRVSRFQSILHGRDFHLTGIRWTHKGISLPVGTAIFVLVDKSEGAGRLCRPVLDHLHQSVRDCANSKGMGFAKVQVRHLKLCRAEQLPHIHMP